MRNLLLLPTPEGLATHEAGHAVARLALNEMFQPAGPPLDGATIRPQGSKLGETVMEDRVPVAVLEAGVLMPDGLQAAALDAVEALAGPLAEVRHGWPHAWGNERWQAAARGLQLSLTADCADGDTAVVAKLLYYLTRHGAGERGAVLARLWCVAVALLDQGWPAVEAVADALLLAGELDGHTIERVWRAARPSEEQRARTLHAMDGEAKLAWQWLLGLGGRGSADARAA